MYWALVDCNNFFVSCERIFRPKLRGIPVVVLSNNDGCIIARSNEAKALGIPMGAPYFEWRETLERHKVQLFSSNFPLYRDISTRVMQTLNTFPVQLQVYSVDEAFLYTADPSLLPTIKEKIFRWTGIPVSIGMSRSKTLAKVASKLAKKDGGICTLLTEQEISEALQSFPVADIWGVGRKMAPYLQTKGIHTALQLRQRSPQWARQQRGVFFERLVSELQGHSCLGFDELPTPKKSIMHSRSFGRPIQEFNELFEALASYLANAAEKLREQQSLAAHLSLFAVRTKRQNNRFLTRHADVALPEPTNHTPTFFSVGKELLQSIYQEGESYRKVGVCLSGFMPQKAYQPTFFVKEEPKKQKLMKLMDQINQNSGRGTIRFAAEADAKAPWRIKCSLRSPRYTTCWEELPIVK